MTIGIKALGEFVVIKSFAESAGKKQYSDGGLFLGELKEGQMPEYCIIEDIGDKVPAGHLNIGDRIPIPHGKMSNIPHPDVMLKKCDAKDYDWKYSSVHYTYIQSIYVGEPAEFGE